MILADSSVWIGHLRARNAILVDLLEKQRLLTHPVVIGELALGSIRNRSLMLAMLSRLDRVRPASDAEMLVLVDRHRLWARGIGYADAMLLTSVRITPGASLWTHDKRLAQAADELNLSARLDS